MSGYTALVTGSNRGIGLGQVEYLAANAGVDIVFAAVRHPEQATALHALVQKFGKKIIPVKLELDEASAAVCSLLKTIH
jgi:NAD(P)-dependent dehydrogenase (short-subunit alcohol dehydrogenase family)